MTEEEYESILLSTPKVTYQLNSSFKPYKVAAASVLPPAKPAETGIRFVSTRYVYEHLSLSCAIHPDIDAMCSAIQEKNLQKLAGRLGNILEHQQEGAGTRGVRISPIPSESAVPLKRQKGMSAPSKTPSS